MLYESPVRVQVVQDRICISLLTGSEDYDLKVLVGFLQTFDYERSNVDASAYYVLWVLTKALLREVNLQYDIRVFFIYIVHTMDQSLIHVKDNDLLLIQWSYWVREHDSATHSLDKHFYTRWRCEVFGYVF